MKKRTPFENPRSGSSLIVIIVVIVLLGGIAYYLSDPFKAKMDEAYTDLSKWTPENMAKDPGGYLAWARKEMDSVEVSLEGRMIGLKQLNQKYDREGKTAAMLRDRYATVLPELKAAYKEAKESDSWPATTANGELSETQLRDIILDADERITDANLKIDRYKKATSSIENDIATIAKSLKGLEQKKRELEQQIELARLSEDMSNFEDLIDSVNTLTDVSSSIQVDDPTTVTLDDFVKTDEESISDEQSDRFDQIMSN